MLWKARASLATSVALLAPTMTGAACVQASLSIDTSTLNSLSGCYKETIYGGLYETTVWTIDGSDIVAPAGTKAIVADLVSLGSFYSKQPLLVARGCGVVSKGGNTRYVRCREYVCAVATQHSLHKLTCI